MSQVMPTIIFKDTYTKLDAFRKQLDMSIVTDQEIKQIIDFLKKESSLLSRHMVKAGPIKEKVTVQESVVPTDILKIIQYIHQSPASERALGQYQLEFSNILKRFEQIIKKWESKVERVDNQRLE